MKSIKVAIDGYSGCGKSSTAKAIAKTFGYRYIDSGAMYRGVTYRLLEQKIPFDDQGLLLSFLDKMSMEFRLLKGNKCHLFENNVDLEPFLRTMEVNKNVSVISTNKEVRKRLVAEQRKYGKGGGIVMDGRDIGTVVFPDAELKLFLTANLEVRAQRRQVQLNERGVTVSLEEIIDNFKERDRIDSSRTVGPLKKAEDAIEIDTSNLTFAEQLRIVERLVEKEIHES